MSKIPDEEIGRILMMDFSSSTLCTVANFHKFGGAFGSLAWVVTSQRQKMERVV